MNWTANQFVGCAFNPFGHDISIKRWNRLMEKRWHGFVTVGQFMNTSQSFDNFCQTLDIFVQCLTYWFHWGFSFLSNLARHLLPVQISYQNSPKIFFRQKLNNFNKLQKFSRGSDFGTRRAITYTEHDENLPFTGGVGIGRPDIIPRRFNEAQIDIGFHTPRNLWKPNARWRNSETGD